MLPFDNKKAASLIVARLGGSDRGHEQKSEEGIDGASQDRLDLGSDLLAALKSSSPGDLYAAIEAIVHHCQDSGDDGEEGGE